ncbi:MAG: DUF488 family protein [Gemmatimonadaceae bacterium]
MRLYTIGHSTRPLDEFIELLRREGIERLVDVRAFPASRRYPQYNREALQTALQEAGVEYSHRPALGGRRTPRPDSTNTGLRNSGFRGFADHMETAEFRGALDELLAMAVRQRVAVMCAEAVPWRCHRSLISDAAVARGAEVFHILDAGTGEHRLTGVATVADGLVRYPPAASPAASGGDRAPELFDSP